MTCDFFEGEFLFGERLQQAVHYVLSGENVRCAVAFWGSGSENYFKAGASASSFRLVCNLRTGGTNPKTIRILNEMCNGGIKHSDRLHSKVYISKLGAVVGSANASINGLGLQGNAQAKWTEAAVFVPNVEENSNWENVSRWFEDIFSNSLEITSSDFATAQKLWDGRLKPTVGGLIDIDVEEASERFWPIWYDDSEGKLNTPKVRAIIGDWPDAEIESNYIEIGSKEIDLDESWCLIFRLHRGRIYKSTFSWFYAQRRIDKVYRRDRKFYPILIGSFPPRPEPISLSRRDRNILASLLSAEKYALFRDVESWNPWATDARRSLLRSFWSDAREQATEISGAHTDSRIGRASG